VFNNSIVDDAIYGNTSMIVQTI